MNSTNPLVTIALAALGLLFLGLFICVMRASRLRGNWCSSGFLGKLIVFSQLLVFVCIALVFVSPLFPGTATSQTEEKILIIDGSVSMLSETNDESRLDRAVFQMYEDVSDAFEDDAKVSVIFAGMSPRFLARGIAKEEANVIYDALDTMLQTSFKSDFFGKADIDGAMKLAEEITSVNGNASVTLYTDQRYLDTGKVNVCNVSGLADWNTAVLDVRATLVEDYYRFEIDIACYGADKCVTVYCDVYDTNGNGSTMCFETDVLCMGDAVQTIVFANITDDMPLVEQEMIAGDVEIFSYDYIHVSVSEKDSVKTDNEFYLYGGTKPTLRIQYYSTLPNIFYTTALFVLKDALANDWNVEIIEVNGDATPATEGFDIYIFEHSAPATVPTDGLVIYTDAKNVPNAAGIQLVQEYENPASFNLYPGEGADHPIMNNIDPSKISVKKFLYVGNSDGYIPLMVFDTVPFLLLKEEVDQKILFMP